MDGNAPHSPRGCFAQAWSVSETLRAYHSLTAKCARTTATEVSGG
jgi:glycogen debranching enzyme